MVYTYNKRSCAATLPYVILPTSSVARHPRVALNLRLVRLSSMHLSQVGWTTITAYLQD